MLYGLYNKYHLKYIPYQDGYKKYTQIMGETNWDIGLAPMPISKFHECKYFNKYVEYASYGIAGIYTNTKPYTFGIKDKVNGLLVDNNKKDWVDALSLLIEDNELRKNISKQALIEANGKYSLDTLSKQYLERITKNYLEVEKQTIEITKKIKRQIFIAMLKDKILVQKWHFPFWCIKFITIKVLEKLGLKDKVVVENDWEL